MRGDRVADLFAADVDVAELVPTLRPLLTGWSSKRRPGENLSDYYQRLIQHDQPRRKITGAEEATLPLVQLGLAR